MSNRRGTWRLSTGVLLDVGPFEVIRFVEIGQSGLGKCPTFSLRHSKHAEANDIEKLTLPKTQPRFP
jgi:hypothetical protein